MKRYITVRICFLLLLASGILQFRPPLAFAHSGSHGYSDVTINDHTMTYDLFLLGDLLGGLLNIDKNQDGYMKEDEISQSKPEIEQFVLKNLSVINNGIKGQAQIKTISMTERANYQMFRISMEFSFDEPIEEYEIDYNLFFNDVDKNHQNFMTIKNGQEVIEHLFTKGHIVFQGHAKMDTPQETSGVQPSSKTEGQDSTGTLGFGDYLLMGMKHIWSGIDHLLFLFGLLLMKGSYKDYLKILTAFTVGHSITLALASLEILIIPGSIIEPLIALSIIYVAAENIFAKSIKWRWLITLFFGMIHGFGFAEVLIGKLDANLFAPLLSFNLGVEIGQIVVLIILFPLIWHLRKIRWQTIAVHSASAIISLIGLYWFIERVI
ncbi:HupE/UreJ family protein [Neobacillus muris]|uniref:HupE/UreJ family protein n=1 Tax=Neobacillus muris TaxID=2941334 RepID=UPI00203B1A26|nr:HupE/UreJ family protein [Neobacillus muris]